MLDLQVENIKCGGCASRITAKLQELEGVEQVEINVEDGIVSVQLTDQTNEALQDEIRDRLKTMGYPLAGSVHGLESAGAKAKSFVSCAIGRMSDDAS
ncbi:heavy-metal-associated domain-containing protein [Thiomicrorhabdus sp.]|uniref:heavy-metal-associated domain-containing protein n=1 Tax=Thiomicrorhabdus sp. TaxID=2039724 RepID=UPI0029C77D05|nr:heavy-metal-associated domain-containing protein [Thiomicrorhabdus sp.]